MYLAVTERVSVRVAGSQEKPEHLQGTRLETWNRGWFTHKNGGLGKTKRVSLITG